MTITKGDDMTDGKQLTLFDTPAPPPVPSSAEWARRVLDKDEQPRIDHDPPPDHNESAERRQERQG